MPKDGKTNAAAAGEGAGAARAGHPKGTVDMIREPGLGCTVVKGVGGYTMGSLGFTG